MNGKINVFIILASCMLAANGLRCYICNSGDSKQGGDKCLGSKLDDSFLKECNEGNASLCRKITQWVDSDYGDELKSNERTIRTCGYVPTERDCYYRAGFGGRQQVCTCKDTDGCNSAVPISMATLAMLAPLLAFLVSKLR